MITCDAVSVSLYRNTGVSLSRHAVTHDFVGALVRDHTIALGDKSRIVQRDEVTALVRWVGYALHHVWGRALN
jgi:hypothetical protein